MRLAPLEQQVVDRVDGSIFVLAPSDPPLDADVGADAKRGYRAQLGLPCSRPGRRGAARCAATSRRRTSRGKRASRSRSTRTSSTTPACATGTTRASACEPMPERFDRAEEVRIVGDGTDLHAEPRGSHRRRRRRPRERARRRGLLLPGRGLRRGRRSCSTSRPAGSSGARLVLRGGEVVEASADAGEDVLHAGARHRRRRAALRRARARLQRRHHPPPAQRPLRREDGRNHAPRARPRLPEDRRPQRERAALGPRQGHALAAASSSATASSSSATAAGSSPACEQTAQRRGGTRLGEDDTGEDRGAADPAGRAEPVAGEPEAEQSGEHRLEREHERGLRRGRLPLRPGLNEEGERAREDAGDDQRSPHRPAARQLDLAGASATSEEARERGDHLDLRETRAGRSAARTAPAARSGARRPPPRRAPAGRRSPSRPRRRRAVRGRPSRDRRRPRPRADAHAKQRQREQRREHDVEPGDEAGRRDRRPLEAGGLERVADRE